jgi:hypothetical protein
MSGFTLAGKAWKLVGKPRTQNLTQMHEVPQFKDSSQQNTRMSQDHTLMASRYELKYHVSQTVALQIRDFVQQHLELDDYGQSQPNFSYPVHSVYLDSDDWQIYWRTVNGDKNRYKLRIRYYNDQPDTPVFFEIKRRMKDVILKQRCAIPRSQLPGVFAGHFPNDARFNAKSPKERFALERFFELAASVNARPKMHVAYQREAYVSTFNNEVRLTMDRAVECAPRFDGRLIARVENPIACTRDIVILELKFTGRFPNWYRDLVRSFNCVQTGASKYIEGTMLYLSRGLAEPDIPRTLR